MKLKKVTALLLATSMVVSSVSVASFADELVFEDEIVTAEDNAGEEVSFDDLTFEDVAEDEVDYSEEVFEDEVIGEDTAVVDETFYTEEVSEEQTVEELEDPNADIYAALAGAEEVVVEDVVDGQTVTDEAYYVTTQVEDVTAVYDGQPHKLDYKKAGIKEGEIRFKTDDNTYTFEEPSLTNAGDKVVTYQVLENAETGTWSIDQTANITVTAKPVTASLKTKAYTYADNKVGELEVSSFDYEGLVSGETVANAITAVTPWSTVVFYKQITGGWDTTPIPGVIPTELNAGTYRAVFTGVTFTANNNNYFVTAPECVVTVAKQTATAVWDVKTQKLTYTGSSQEHTASGAPTGFVFVYEDNAKTEVGKYTAKIKGVAASGTPTIVSPNFEVVNPTDDFEITKAKAYATIKRGILATIEYGAKDPVASFTKDILDINIPRTETVSGTPVFKTTYKQGDKIGNYNVAYVSGLSSKNYEVVPVKDNEGTFKVVPAKVTIKPTSVTVPYGADPLEPVFTLADTTLGSGSAEVLKNDIANNKLTLTVFVSGAPDGTKVTPVEPKVYYYGKELANTVADSKAKDNFDVTVDGNSTYTVTKSSVSLSFADYEGAYDGKYHGIVVTPDPSTLPKDVTIYYSATETGTYSIKPVEKIDPVEKSPVYYYVEQAGTRITKGWNTITILDAGDAAVKEVEKKIEEATKKDASGNYDVAKVVAAREAYDALTPAQKEKVSPYSKKALEEAEAAIGPQDDWKKAKAVEDKIDALPAAADATAETKPAADEAKAAYDALTDAQKALVPADKVKKLDDVKAAADKAAEDQAAAKAVEDQIDALPAAADVTAATKPAAEAAKAAYDALTDAQKALVPAEKVQKMNDVLAAAEKKDEEAEKEVEAFDQGVAAVAATKSGAEGKAAAEAAKEAYENLSDDAKAKLTEDEIKAYEKTQEAFREGKKFTAGKNETRATYRVLSTGELAYVEPADASRTWYVVPNQVKHNGFVYRITYISKKAFLNNNANKIVVGKYVQRIGEYAFKNTKAMKTLKVKTRVLVANKVVNAFVASGRSAGAKLTVVAPNGLAGSYESMFKGDGGMSAGATFTEED